MKKYLLLIIIIFGLSGAVWYYRQRTSDNIKVDLPTAQNYQDFVDSTTSTPEIVDNTSTPIIEQPQVAEKRSINLAVPFSSQAPTANWAQPWQDACEEASVLMVDYYYQNKNLPGKEEVEGILVDMVKWQEDNWGAHDNLPIARLADFVLATFNYRSAVIEDLTVAKIKNYLDRGVPVIVPANGKKLANPNFRNGGPVYHMLVIKGYVDDKFITNDPGTRLGADFIYTQANLLESIADWDTKEAASSGPKRALILYRD